MTDSCYYPKGDLRRMLIVLAAMDTMSEATLVKIVASTRLDKKTVTNLIATAQEQAQVEIVKDGPVYTLVNWGPALAKEGALSALDHKLGTVPKKPTDKRPK